MAIVVTLGGSANAPCPKCSRSVAFFRGKQGDFISEVKNFASDRLVPLECREHGPFEVRAGDFRDRLS